MASRTSVNKRQTGAVELKLVGQTGESELKVTGSNGLNG